MRSRHTLCCMMVLVCDYDEGCWAHFWAHFTFLVSLMWLTNLKDEWYSTRSVRNGIVNLAVTEESNPEMTWPYIKTTKTPASPRTAMQTCSRNGKWPDLTAWTEVQCVDDE